MIGRNFLSYKKECALAHSHAECGRLRHISSSRECASRGAFLCHRAKFPIEVSYDIKKTFIPVIRTKVCSSSLYHLLHHTNICVPSNGRIPAQLTFEYHSRSSPCAFLCIPAFRFSLQLRSDLHHLRYLHRASTFPGSLWLSSQDYCLHLSFSSMTILL